MLKKLILALGVFCGGFGAAFATNSLFWAVGPGSTPSTPSVTGPWLGDSVFNISSLYTAHARDAGSGFAPSLSVSQTTSQAGCTQLPNDAFIEVKTSAGTGSVCLPTAVAGKRVMIGNASGQTIDIFGSAVTFLPGTQDTINGTPGSSAYTGLTNGKNAICFAANNGAWYCGSIS